MPAEMAAAGAAAQGAGATGAAGVIHDIGYRRYEGKRHRHPGIVWALYLHSLRGTLGLGRGAKAKIIPIAAFLAMCLPAVVNAFAVAQTGVQQVYYDTYTNTLRVLVVMVFVGVQAPELVSGDRRYQVLQLYFARPMRRSGYPLAKLAALVTACLLLIELPLLLLYAGTISSEHGTHAVWLQTKQLIPGLGYGALWAVLLAAIGLVLASLSGRRTYATGTVAGTLFVSFVISHILIRATQRAVRTAMTFRPPPGAALPPGAKGGVVHGFAVKLVPTTAAKLMGLTSPFTILDSLRQWIGGSSHPTAVPNPGSYGAIYLGVFIALLVVAGGGLFLRYRKAGLS